MLMRMAKHHRFFHWKTLQLQKLAPQAQAHEAHTQSSAKRGANLPRQTCSFPEGKTMVLNIGAPTPDDAEIVRGATAKVQCFNIRMGCYEADISEMRVSR